MRRIRTLGLSLMGVCVMGFVGAGAAVASPPELGQCKAVEGVKEGKKTKYSGGFNNKSCTSVSSTHTGKYEWTPGPGPEKKFSGAGASGEIVTLETVGGRTIKCGQGRTEGEYTGPKTEKLIFILNGCEDSVTHKSCQSYSPEAQEPKPIPGKIVSNALKGELGFINAAKKVVGWDVKPESGSEIAFFECGELFVGTKVFLSGSYINQLKPVNKMAIETFQTYKAVKGKQAPESFEGGPKDTINAKFLTGLEESNEQIGYIAKEEVPEEEELEYKAS